MRAYIPRCIDRSSLRSLKLDFVSCFFLPKRYCQRCFFRSTITVSITVITMKLRYRARSFSLFLSLSLSFYLSLSLSLSLSVLYPSSSFLCTCKITAAKEPYVLKLFSRGIRKSIFRLCSRLWFDNRCQAIEPSTRNVVGNAIS